jgi:hypothetical protein
MISFPCGSMNLFPSTFTQASLDEHDAEARRARAAVTAARTIFFMVLLVMTEIKDKQLITISQGLSGKPE